MQRFPTPTVVILILAFAVALLAVSIFVEKDNPLLGSGAQQDIPAIDTFGTLAAKMRLTNNLATSTARVTKGFDKIVCAGNYEPKTNNAYAQFLAEGSIDNGVTYMPIPATVVGTTEVDVFADGGSSFGAATSGLPYVFPGDKTTTAGVAVSSTNIIVFESSAFSHIRLSAMEVGATTNGLLWLQCGGKVGN